MMKRVIKKTLGGFLLSLPLIGYTILVAIVIGTWETLLVVGATIAAFVLMILGVKLLISD